MKSYSWISSLKSECLKIIIARHSATQKILNNCEWFLFICKEFMIQYTQSNDKPKFLFQIRNCMLQIDLINLMKYNYAAIVYIQKYLIDKMKKNYDYFREACCFIILLVAIFIIAFITCAICTFTDSCKSFI